MTEIEKPTTTDETPHVEAFQCEPLPLDAEVVPVQRLLLSRSQILITGLILAAVLLAVFGATAAFAAANNAATVTVPATGASSVTVDEDGTVTTITTTDGVTTRETTTADGVTTSETTTDDTVFSLQEGSLDNNLGVRFAESTDANGEPIVEFTTDGGLTWSTKLPEGFAVEVNGSGITISSGNTEVIGAEY